MHILTQLPTVNTRFCRIATDLTARLHGNVWMVDLGDDDTNGSPPAALLARHNVGASGDAR